VIFFFQYKREFFSDVDGSYFLFDVLLEVSASLF